jgi:dephospho-CoA kinase
MLLIGLTGGIAAGKSTVSRLLAERGAEIVDADQIARLVVQPGEPAWHKIREHFGADVIAEDGAIDRQKLAERVFADPAKVALLNEITHPAILERIADQLEALAGKDVIAVLDAALLIETGLDAGVDLVLVVNAPREAQIERLEAKGVDRAHATARIAAQADERQRLERADIVIDNDGTLAELETAVDAVWEELSRRLAGGPAEQGRLRPDRSQ